MYILYLKLWIYLNKYQIILNSDFLIKKSSYFETFKMQNLTISIFNQD